MAERRVLASRLRRFDEEIAAEGMPSAARERVAERLRRESIAREATSGFRVRWLPALTFAAGAALVLLVVGLGLRSAPRVDETSASASVLGVFTVRGEDCRHRSGSDQTVLDGNCRLVAPHMTVQTWERVVLRDDVGLRLVEGTALFEVSHVDEGEEPVRIHVSHGTIEVIGTRFTIEQGPTGGHVDLFEGRIRFVGLAGDRTEIEPGQRHAWGDAVLAETEIDAETQSGPVDRTVASRESARDQGDEGHGGHEGSDAAGEPSGPAEEAEVFDGSEVRRESVESAERRGARASRTRRVPSGEPEPASGPALPEGSAEDATTIIEEVSGLRAQGRFADAAVVLRRAEAERRWDRRTAQVLSFELGEIIERHLDDEARACAHWTRHAARFPGGRYDAAVAAARERLRCADGDGAPGSP